MLALLVDWAFGVSLDTAVLTAVITSAVVIVLLELAAGLRAKQSGLELVVQTLFGAMLGVLIIALRLVLH